MATDWYAPNQQAVRPDGSGPAEEGNGGSTHTPPEQPRRSSDEEKSSEKSESRKGSRKSGSEK